jgi:hypothetical protein
LILAVILVFNFILDMEGDAFEEYPPDLWEQEAQAQCGANQGDVRDDDDVAENLRNRIANLMWLDYLRYLETLENN